MRGPAVTQAILSFIPGRKVLHENAENDKRSNSNKRVFFFFQIYMVNLLHDFVVYVYLCLVRHNLLFRRSREDLLDLQRGRIQKFLFDTGLRGMSGSNLKSRFWAIYKLILLPLKSKLAVKKHSSPVTLLTCNHVPVSRKSRKLFGPRKMFCACVCIQIKINVSKGPLGPVWSVFRKARQLFGPKGKFWNSNLLNSSTVNGPQTNSILLH